MSKWTNDKKFCKSRNAWDASVALGMEKTPWFINLMSEKRSETAQKLTKSNYLNDSLVEPKQDEYTLHTLYCRQDNDRRKATKHQCKKSTNLTEIRENISVQHIKAHPDPTSHNETSNSHQTNQIASNLNKSKQRGLLQHISKSSHNNKTPFLYENYPLRPALLYGSPSSFICDPLKRLKQIPYLPESPELKFISSALSICQSALVNPECMSTTDVALNIPQSEQNYEGNVKTLKNSEQVVNVKKSTASVAISAQNARLESGREEVYRNRKAAIAESVFQRRNSYAVEGKVCPTCHRNAFLVPRDLEYALETTIAFDDVVKQNNFENATVANKVHKHVQPLKESFIDFREIRRRELTELKENQQLPSPQLTASGISLAPDNNASVPIFEVLSKNDYKTYANQPSLKQKDSILLYKDSRRKQNNKQCHAKTCEPRVGKSAGLVRFFDEVNLDYKPSDKDIVFGSVKGLRGKSQSWERSRIEWLTELERRQEVRRRRKRRFAYRKWEQGGSESYLAKCTFLCQRIRMWLANWAH